MRATISCLLITMLLAAGSSAADWGIELEPANTRIGFTLKATLHTVRGSARLASGSLTLDPGTGGLEGTVVIDATSAETGNAKRDRKMHREVLRSELHPEILLQARRIEGPPLTEGDNSVVLVAELVLLDVAHPVRLPMELRLEGSRAVVDLSFEIPYVAWGLDDPSKLMLRVAKEVEVTVVGHARLAIPDTPG